MENRARRRRLARTVEKTPPPAPRVEKPLDEIPRVVGIIEETQAAINETFGLGVSLRLTDTDQGSRNVFFVPQQQIFEISWAKDFENSSFIKALDQNGLPYSFAFRHQYGDNRPIVTNGSDIFLAQERFLNLRENPDNTLTKTLISKGARNLFNFIGSEVIDMSRTPTPIESDDAFIDRALKTLLSAARKGSLGLEREEEIRAFLETYDPRDIEGNKLTLNAVGGEVEIVDNNGRILTNFSKYQQSASGLLVLVCGDIFGEHMKKRFPWYVSFTEKEKEIDAEYIYITMDALRHAGYPIDMSNPQQLLKDYLSNKIAIDLPERRKRYNTWRQERQEERVITGKLLNQGVEQEVIAFSNNLSHVTDIKASIERLALQDQELDRMIEEETRLRIEEERQFKQKRTELSHSLGQVINQEVGTLSGNLTRISDNKEWLAMQDEELDRMIEEEIRLQKERIAIAQELDKLSESLAQVADKKELVEKLTFQDEELDRMISEEIRREKEARQEKIKREKAKSLRREKKRIALASEEDE